MPLAPAPGPVSDVSQPPRSWVRVPRAPVCDGPVLLSSVRMPRRWRPVGSFRFGIETSSVVALLPPDRGRRVGSSRSAPRASRPSSRRLSRSLAVFELRRAPVSSGPRCTPKGFVVVVSVVVDSDRHRAGLVVAVAEESCESVVRIVAGRRHARRRRLGDRSQKLVIGDARAVIV